MEIVEVEVAGGEVVGYAKRHGYRKLQTQNEERNAPIRALNQRFGYVLEPGDVTMRGSLATYQS